MLDLDLLRSFVSVVDAGGFTRAGERVHRTQSTVSQQIKRLEDDLGRPLFNRIGKQVTPTEDGERLLSYARRILSLVEEARDVVSRPIQDGAVRLGIPEDFAAARLTQLLASCARSRPGLRLDVRADQSVFLRRDLERGELDLALLKRDAGETGGLAVWPERLHWVTSKSHPVDLSCPSVPLIGFPAGCIYRARAIHAIESAGRAWHMAYSSSNLTGIQAAGRGRARPQHPLRYRRPTRAPRADGEGRLRADRQNRDGPRGGSPSQPGDLAARRSSRGILRFPAGQSRMRCRGPAVPPFPKLFRSR